MMEVMDPDRGPCEHSRSIWFNAPPNQVRPIDSPPSVPGRPLHFNDSPTHPVGLNALRVHSKKRKNEVSGFHLVTMGHPEGQVAKLYFSVINPFVLFSEVLAVPSGRETKVAA